MMTMESVEPIIIERATLKDEEKTKENTVLSSKPLHRFVRTQPRVLGIAVLIFGCAEVMMGFPLASQSWLNSSKTYTSFWQGLLFLVCGSLSIYTDKYPSKKMVTVCLSMYVVTILGIVVSVSMRLIFTSRYHYYVRWTWGDDPWGISTLSQILAVENTLVASSLCVFILLIVLSVTARLALKSTQAQVIIRHIPAPQRDKSSN